MPSVSWRPLRDHEDAFGHLLRDYLAGEAGRALLERDDGYVGPALPARSFFMPYGLWPSEEQRVFDLVQGRVLDVGCGAGRHSLAAEDQGLAVVAIDISPGALEVSAKRGVDDVRLLPLAAVDARVGIFDTVLMMCGNFGLVGSAHESKRILQTLHAMTTPAARIILDSVDPYVGSDAADDAYRDRNRSRGRMPGQVTIRIRYRERVTPWFDLLNVSPSELEPLVVASGWQVTCLVPGEAPDYYAVLEKLT